MTGVPHALMLIIQASIVALGLALGLDASVGDVLHLVTRPAKFARTFLALAVIVPAAAAILVRLPPLIGPVQAGILLMALAPVPPIVPPRSLRLGATRAYVYGLYVTFVVLTVVTVPVTVHVLSLIFHVPVRVPLLDVARDLVVTVLAPVALGMIVHARWPAAAKRIGPHIERISTILLTALVALVIAASWRQLVALLGNGTLLVMIGVVGIGLIGGHLLGGPAPNDRPALASASGIRHPGIALMIAQANFPDKRVHAAIVLFALVGVIMIVVYRAAVARWQRVRPPVRTVG